MCVCIYIKFVQICVFIYINKSRFLYLSVFRTLAVLKQKIYFPFTV